MDSSKSAIQIICYSDVHYSDPHSTSKSQFLNVSVIQIPTDPDKTVSNLHANWEVFLTYSSIKVAQNNFKLFQISGEVTALDQNRSIYCGLDQESSLSTLTLLQLRDQQAKINQQVCNVM